ncbi:MAG: UvrD-helicase domain-containing protein [Tissierellia bacterium]|nr:UvrD-helicase domain-containing protein [Tissierellia bacterium]
MNNNLLKYLNKQQKLAVITNDRPLLILAGAGSGKTRVLTTKIAYLIENSIISERNILAFTFTNKAAKEMKERVSDLLARDISHMWIGTFHSICSRILRYDIDRLGYSSSFTIYDTQDSKNLIKEILKRQNIDEKILAAKTVVSKISDYKNRFVSPQEVINSSVYPREKQIGQVYEAYEKEKKSNNALDFDDLILKTIELLNKNKDLKEKYSNLFGYIFVDEYQDTNKSQYELIRLFTYKHSNICVVGDSDQSIYSWRGADITNILNFEKDFKDAQVILLEQNYRSSQRILDAANLLIKNNKERKDKNLWTDNNKGYAPEYKRYLDERSEAADTINKIYQMYNDGIDYSEMAILYRTNAQSRAFEEKLMYEGIPHKIVGGLKFYDRKEVKDMVSYLYFIANPDDNLTFKRIINVPKRGIGQTSVAKLENFANSLGKSMFAAIDDDQINEVFNKATLGKLRTCAEMFQGFIRLSMELDLSDFVWDVYERSGYASMLANEKTVESKSRIENVEALLNAVSEFVKENPDTNLQEYLQTVSLLSDVDKTSDERGVNLMTIHAAKGLEYDLVFLTGMEEGLFPSKMSMEEGGLEEERRLCYVAITRAKKKLYISSCENRYTFGQSIRTMPSRFIDEIYEALDDKTEKREVDPYDNFVDFSYLEEKKKEVRKQLKSKIELAKSKNSGWEYRVGDKVRHKKFGRGMIVQIKEMDSGKELMISFDNAGLKRLASNIAPLEKL